MKASMSAGMSRVSSCMPQEAAARPTTEPAVTRTTTLGHELTEETEAGCPECAADASSRLAALGSDQEQARHVDARDQEQQPGPAEQQQQHRAEVADDDFRQGKHAGTLAAVRVRVLCPSCPRDDLRVGERRLDRDTLLEPGDPREAVAASPQVARTRRVDRRPELRRPPGRELETPGEARRRWCGDAAEHDAPADTSGLPPNRDRQAASLRITVPGAPGESSPARKSRPSTGATPSVRKKPSLTRAPGTSWAPSGVANM